MRVQYLGSLAIAGLLTVGTVACGGVNPCAGSKEQVDPCAGAADPCAGVNPCAGADPCAAADPCAGS
jgi:hypothetical protein